ncbi:MAG: Crp/Fnr family transcriptional regulator [Fimbriimonadaceae bacterium]|jgi:CRP-like cAMP-binding protein|nr:Crp/Fnr family transcriptional regulator [Fimbriimonadaceae bacterium]
MNWVDYLRRIPLFAGLSSYHLLQIAELCTVRTIEKGQVLFRQGETGHQVFIILSGKISIDFFPEHSQEVTLAVRGAGEVIGEMAILEDLPRSAAATALRFSRLIVLNRKDFTQLVKKNPEVALAVMQHLSQRIRKMSNDLTESRSESLQSRIQRSLKSRANSQGIVVLDFPQRVLAQEIGCTREALSRNLANLVRSGHLERVSRRTFRIR